MSSVSKRKKEGSRGKMKTMGDHKEFLKRITKTLYYGQLPALPCLSLPVTEIACEVWSAAQRGRSLRRLRADAAAAAARAACVSPCALVLALLYVERLQRCNPDYLSAADPHELFLVSLMVSNKFLQDDGEDDEVICSEWASSGGLQLHQLKKLELDFLNAIDWNVFVSARSFAAGLARLERRVALRQARARGWFTYSDLQCAAPALAAAARACATAAAALVASALLLAHLPPHQPEPAPSGLATPAESTTPSDLSTTTDMPPNLLELPPNLHEQPLYLEDLPPNLHEPPPSLRDTRSLDRTSLTFLPTRLYELSNLRIQTHVNSTHHDTSELDRFSPLCCRGWQLERDNRTRSEHAPPSSWWAAEWLQNSALAEPRKWLGWSREETCGGRGLRAWLGVYAAAISDR